MLRYEQHPRPLDDYDGDNDPGFDGVTVQWFESMDAYRAHMGEPDFPAIWTDIERFLDTDRLHFIVTEHRASSWVTTWRHSPGLIEAVVPAP